MDKNKKKQVIEKQAEDALKTEFIRDLLQNNEKDTEHNGIRYKVREFTHEEKEEVINARRRYSFELLDDNTCYTEEQIKKKLKAKGIDLEEKERELKRYQNNIDELRLKIGALLEKAKETGIKYEKDMDKLAQEIEDLVGKQFEIISFKSQWLEDSFEMRVNIYTTNYIAYLVTEKLVGKKWVKAFKSFEQFKKQDSILIDKLTRLVSALEGSRFLYVS